MVVSNYNLTIFFSYYKQFKERILLSMSFMAGIQIQKNLFFLKFFLLKFFKLFLKDKSFFLSFQRNMCLLLSRKLFNKLLIRKVKHLKYLQPINFLKKAIVSLFLTSLYSKDPILLKNGIKYIFENLKMKSHKRFVSSIKLLLKVLLQPYFNYLGCLGIYISITGKVGVGGNSKTKKFLIKFGKFSFAAKKQRLNYAKGIMRVYAGVLGIEVYLAF